MSVDTLTGGLDIFRTCTKCECDLQRVSTSFSLCLGGLFCDLSWPQPVCFSSCLELALAFFPNVTAEKVWNVEPHY